MADDRSPILAPQDDFEVSSQNIEIEEDAESNASNETAQEGQIETRVYLKRWYILAVFSVLGILQVRTLWCRLLELLTWRCFTQGMIWNSFGPISSSLLSVFCPDWTPSTLALLGNWGNIMYIIPVLPMLWFFETKGLRKSMILTAGMMLVGTGLRCIPGIGVKAFTWMAHVCAILNGVAGIVIFSAPAAVSSAWFPPGERTTATGIAIVFNNLGNAVSFLSAPAIVPDPPNGTDITPDHCPTIADDTARLIEYRLSVLMFLEASLVGVCFLFIMAHFPSKPKIPPSVTSSMERLDFLAGVKRICM